MITSSIELITTQHHVAYGIYLHSRKRPFDADEGVALQALKDAENRAENLHMECSEYVDHHNRWVEVERNVQQSIDRCRWYIENWTPPAGHLEVPNIHERKLRGLQSRLAHQERRWRERRARYERSYAAKELSLIRALHRIVYFSNQSVNDVATSLIWLELTSRTECCKDEYRWVPITCTAPTGQDGSALRDTTRFDTVDRPPR